MSKKEFNKKDFKKSQNKLALFFAGIGAIGLASTITGLCIPLVKKKIQDPKDYYQTYYAASSSYEFYEFTFNEENCQIKTSFGLGEYATFETADYKFVSTTYAKKEYNYSAPLEGCDKVIIMDNPKSDQKICFWVDPESKPNDYIFHSVIGTATTKKIELSSLMNDPKNYYGVYYDGSDSVIVGEDGQLAMSISGSSKTAPYAYVSREWVSSVINGHSSKYDNFLVTYNPNNKEALECNNVFGMADDGIIDLLDNKTFACKKQFKVENHLRDSALIFEEEKCYMLAGEKHQLKYSFNFSDVNPAVTFSSSDDRIVSVSENGELSSYMSGKVTITATLENGSVATCEVEVLSSPTFEIEQQKITLYAGESQTLTTKIIPENANNNLTWSSSNANIAIVRDGVVTGVAYGNTTIKATDKYGHTARCEVHVKEVLTLEKVVSDLAEAFSYKGASFSYDKNSDSYYTVIDISGYTGWDGYVANLPKYLSQSKYPTYHVTNNGELENYYYDEDYTIGVYMIRFNSNSHTYLQLQAFEVVHV